jgi:hypothetical protein
VDLESSYGKAIERQAALDESEEQFPCYFDGPSQQNYARRGNEPFTIEELGVLHAVFLKLVLADMLWHQYPLGNPPPLEIAVSLRTSETDVLLSTNFLEALSTPTLRAVQWSEDLDYEIPRCTLMFRSWLSPDSAYVFAEVQRTGYYGRGAIAVRDRTDWTICPTRWIAQD